MDDPGRPPVPPAEPRRPGEASRSPDDDQSRRRRRLWALAAVLGVLLLAGGLATQLDLDRDGLSTWQEAQAGTSPWNGDTDGEGLADGFETARNVNPLDPDTDTDDVDDRRELALATDPRSSDSDGDELQDGRELEVGTDPRSSDTDEDGLRDLLEVDTGTNATAADTEGDGLDDGLELARGASPWVSDTDDDGWGDALEAERGPEDCDEDGYDRVADADDDKDGLVDADEDEAWRCQADADADGILDGDEAARACVELADCDADGLTDAEEQDTEFDRLNPDTFATGLLDGVTNAFKQAGQQPSGDADGDGIPDAWEQTEGLIEWQHFDPEPGRRDLLVEFVRVEGPDSARFGPGSLRPAYAQVERFFEAEGDVEVTWIESPVRLDEETRPPLLPSARETYYRDVLERAKASANPYGTTVVMNPQHDQRQVQHLGVAPIRGMLAAVDYGAHTRITFEANGSTLTMSPYVESLVAAGRLDLLERSGIQDGGLTADGRMVLVHEDWRMSWRPFWFAEPPVQRFEDGTEVRYQRARTELDQAALADTIAHELGHTLGLCHTNLADCQANLSIEDQDVAGLSTMDERRTSNELAFLDSEWSRLREYLSCPPQRAISLLAEGADRSRRIDAKYEITLENALDVGARECRNFDPVPPDLERAPFTRTYDPPQAFAAADLEEEPTRYRADAGEEPPSARIHGAGATVAYAAASGLAALTAAALVHRRA